MARQTFGSTWWGAAWLRSLEERALEDPNRLPRGRTYARQDRVVDLEIAPGSLQARVWGTERYVTQLSVRILSEAEWDRVLESVMARAANVAALLAGEVPHDIGDLVLPDRGDLGPDCSCPDWAEPCKHAAALCYVAADIFDADPFALLALRGRGRDEILAEVRRRRALELGGDQVEASDLPRGSDPGTPATAAFRREPGPQVGPRPTPRQSSSRYVLTAPAPADSGIDDQALQGLVLDAADRAWRMLALGEPSGLDAPVAHDVVRRAARSTDAELHEIAATTGLDAAELEAAALAWRVGGSAAYLVHRTRWEPAEDEMARGSAALGSGARVRGNRVSDGPLQFRLDGDGRWWRFVADDRLGWVLVAGPVADPADLLDV